MASTCIRVPPRVAFQVLLCIHARDLCAERLAKQVSRSHFALCLPCLKVLLCMHA